MIEVIHDKGSHDALVFTDDSAMAKKFKDAFGFDGAHYFGKTPGRSWVAPRQTALDVIRRLGIKKGAFETVEK